MSQRSTSPPSNPSSRPPAGRSPRILQHAPITPSALREAHTLSGSPEEPLSLPVDATHSSNSRPRHSGSSSRGQTESGNGTDDDAEGDGARETIAAHRAVSETTSLLRRPFEIINDPAHAGPCNHGTFSPRMESPEGSILSFGGNPPANQGNYVEDVTSSFLSSLLSKMGMKDQRRKQPSTTSRLAEAHGITNTTSMYVWDFSLVSIPNNQ